MDAVASEGRDRMNIVARHVCVCVFPLTPLCPPSFALLRSAPHTLRSFGGLPHSLRSEKQGNIHNHGLTYPTARAVRREAGEGTKVPGATVMARVHGEVSVASAEAGGAEAEAGQRVTVDMAPQRWSSGPARTWYSPPDVARAALLAPYPEEKRESGSIHVKPICRSAKDALLSAP